MFKSALFVGLFAVLFLAGCTGPQGEQGAQGIQGTQGPQGIQGERGEQGERGLTGAQGAQGIQGIQGERGEQGVQGRRGEQGEQGIPGVQGEPGEQGAPGIQGPPGKPPTLMTYPMIYSLGDLNFIAHGLNEELGGTWDTWENTAGGYTIELTTSEGLVRHALSADDSWWVMVPSSSPASHERLIAGFLRAIGVDSAPALRVAKAAVARRTAAGSSCQGSGMLELYTYRSDDDEWITFFNPVLSSFYERHPAC